MMNFSILAMLSMALVADAHMLMSKPQRFPGQDSGNGPLNNGAGLASNYPCKMSGSGNYQFDFPRTQMPLGSNQTVNFIGTAVHGGGSCQFSLSKDLAPSKSSEFKVIHSVEGGCPARNTAGNLSGGGPDTPDPFEYSFVVPEDIEPGQYTFAWTWFNKVGNREMYMNCAPIEVTGGASKRDAPELEARAASLQSRPNMFLANIPDVECTSPAEGPTANIKFAEPGDSLETNVSPSEMSSPSGQCYAPVGTTSSPSGGASSGASSSGGASSSSGGASASSGGASASSAGATTAGNSGSAKSGDVSDDGSLGGASSASGGASYGASPAGAGASPSASPASSQAGGEASGSDPSGSGSTSSADPSGSGSTSSADPSSSGSTSGSAAGADPSASAPAAGAPALGSGHTTCSTEGAIVCLGQGEFGICNFGFVTPQPLAAGTTCANGQITRKRSLRMPPQARYAQYNRDHFH